VTANPALFMVHMEWDSIPEDTFDSLGFHRCECEALGIFETPARTHSVVIYPNPATGSSVLVNASAPWSEAEISLVTGQRVKTIQRSGISARDGNLDVGDLKEGVYMVRILFDDQSVAFAKIIKR
jgi:hypothetical protein